MNTLDVKTLRQSVSFTRTGALLLIISFAVAGCTPYIWTDFGPAENPAPRIFNLDISPNQISGNTETPVMIQLDYYDPDGDVDIDSRLDVEVVSDHAVSVLLEGSIDQLVKDASGLGGSITKAILIDTTGVYDAGQLTLHVSLRDRAGHRSHIALGQIELLENAPARRISACEIWFVDQPDGQPTDTFRIGQEVFLMVEDLTLGVLEPDVLYAELSGPSAGWSVVVPFFKTGDPHIYASRFGPRLGVNVPARSGQSLLAFYHAFTDRQEICLAQAKVF